MKVHVDYMAQTGGDSSRMRREHRGPLLVVYVWPADKPTIQERLAMQNLLHAVKRVKKVAEPFDPGT